MLGEEPANATLPNRLIVGGHGTDATPVAVAKALAYV
jgi:hypothetical protein